MASDTFEWTTKDPTTLRRILNAKVGDEFKSDIFQIEKINWQIELNPNGWNNASIGQFGVFVKALTIPPNWKNIIVIRTIESPQTHSKYTVPCIYTNNKSYGWSSGALSLREVQQSNLKELTFVVKMKILQIRLQNDVLFYQRKFDYPQKQTLSWTVGEELMNRLDKSTVGKRVESPVYNDMWVIQLSPNGTNTDTMGKCRVVLHLCALPFGVSKMETQVIVNYKSINKKQDANIITFSYLKPASFDTSCSFNEFRQCDVFEIKMDILILKQYDNDGGEIKDIVAKEWNQYIDDEKEILSRNVGDTNMKQYIDDKFALYDIKLKSLSNDVEQMALKLRKIENDEHKDDGNIMNALQVLKKEIKELKIMQRKNKIEDTDKNGIQRWLKQEVELAEYYELFIENGFDDFISIKQMTIEDLEDIGITKLGHRKKIIKFIDDFKYKHNQSIQPGASEGDTPYI